MFSAAWWGAAVVDAEDQRIETANPAFARLHGFPEPADLVGRPFGDLLPTDRLVELEQWRAYEGGSVYESEHRRPDGSLVPVLVERDAAVRRSPDRLLRRDGAGPQRSQADRGAAAPGPAHGGGGPPRGRRRARSEQYDDHHPRLQRSAEPGGAHRGRPAARGGRDQEGGDAGGQDHLPVAHLSRQQFLQPTDLRINTVVEEMAPVLRLMLPANVRVETVLAPPDTVVRADRSQLEQILINLAFNARDAMTSGGTIRLATESRPPGRGDRPAADRHPYPGEGRMA